MADPVTYQRIVLKLRSPWNIAPATEHEWSVKFNLSGDPAMASNEVEPTAIDLFEPIKLLCFTSTYLSGWSYYPNEAHAARDVKTYTPTDHPCTHLAIGQSTEYQQLEVCYLVRALLPNKSSTGKPVWLRKWLHAANSNGTGNEKAPYAATYTDATVFAKWNTGAGPRNVYPIDPTGGSKPANWQLEHHLYTHQLRRGPKRKKTTSTVYIPVPIP